jgi:hypothetical protein
MCAAGEESTCTAAMKQSASRTAAAEESTTTIRIVAPAAMKQSASRTAAAEESTCNSVCITAAPAADPLCAATTEGACNAASNGSSSSERSCAERAMNLSSAVRAMSSGGEVARLAQTLTSGMEEGRGRGWEGGRESGEMERKEGKRLGGGSEGGGDEGCGEVEGEGRMRVVCEDEGCGEVEGGGSGEDEREAMAHKRPKGLDEGRSMGPRGLDSRGAKGWEETRWEAVGGKGARTGLDAAERVPDAELEEEQARFDALMRRVALQRLEV